MQENCRRATSDLMIGSGGEMKRVTDMVIRIAPFDATVFLTGESGVGKNRFARMIHGLSRRRDAPLVTINCGAIPEKLLESELFGYEGGAFTGANKKGKAGMIETADGGTLFLDEIGDLPLQMQVKLLNVIQEKKLIRVGGLETKAVDFRLIAATNKDISAMVKQGGFRKDLFYRLNVVGLTIPPLRKRKEDIPALIHHFVAAFNEKYEKSHVFSAQAVAHLQRYPWPGNVRELENVVEGLILTAEQEVITAEMLPPSVSVQTALEKYEGENKTLKQMLEKVEEEILLDAYQRYGTTTKTAEALGISQASVSIKLNKYKNRQEKTFHL